MSISAAPPGVLIVFPGPGFFVGIAIEENVVMSSTVRQFRSSDVKDPFFAVISSTPGWLSFTIVSSFDAVFMCETRCDAGNSSPDGVMSSGRQLRS